MMQRLLCALFHWLLISMIFLPSLSLLVCKQQRNIVAIARLASLPGHHLKGTRCLGAVSEINEDSVEVFNRIKPGYHRYVARVMYDGTAYSGWQFQPHKYTVQGEILQALQKRFNDEGVTCMGAGRTDAGVHARGQLMHFDVPQKIEDLQKLEYSLNCLLRDDVRVFNVSAPPPLKQYQLDQGLPFHAIVNAESKQYTYRFSTAAVMDPLARRYRTHVYYPLDITRVEAALPFFRGAHDFRSFSNRIESKELEMGVGEGEADTVRTVHRLELVDEGGGDYRLDFHLNGALYKMVRNVVGALFAVGRGALAPGDVPSLFAARSREAANARGVKAAPAEGLTLERVHADGYP